MAKRSGQWVGDRVAQAVQQVPGTGDVIQLLTPALALESIRDIVYERCILEFSIRRTTASTITGVTWMVYKGTVATGSIIPLEALNPNSAAKTTMAHGTIMQVGMLPVPPVNVRFDSAGAFVGETISKEVMTMAYDFHVKRSLHRDSEGVFLTIASNLDDVVDVNVLFRSYYTYA